MLTKIRFKNYRSFSKETIICLEPTKSLILNDTNVYDDVLKGCCFYGPNASGKSGAIEAINILCSLFFLNGTIRRDLFSLFSKEKTMYFEYTFKIDNSIIVYYFEFGRDCRVVKETLYVDGELKLNRLVNSAESYLTERKDYDSSSVDENNLFLKKIYFNTGFVEYPSLKKWIEFLKGSIKFDPINGFISFFGNREKVKDILLINYLNEHGVDDINQFFKEFDFPYLVEYKKDIENMMLGSNPFSRIVFKRNGLPEVNFLIESYGNQLLLNMLPSFLNVVKNGGVLIIDEFSSGLHNKLEHLLVKYFFKHSKNAQLFFVSHSTNLLTTTLLRPDQIYSVDFDNGSSFIKKFSDEQPRESQNLEKMYLAGVFGGIPLYEDKTK